MARLALICSLMGLLSACHATVTSRVATASVVVEPGAEKEKVEPNTPPAVAEVVTALLPSTVRGKNAMRVNNVFRPRDASAPPLSDRRQGLNGSPPATGAEAPSGSRSGLGGVRAMRQRRGGPSHKGRVWRKKPSATQLVDSTRRVEAMEAALKARGKYSTFLTAFNSTGLCQYLYNLLPFFGVTVLAPDNDAFAALSAEQWVAVRSSKTGLLQLMAFHVIFPGYTAGNLTAVIPGTEFTTADYPQAGIVAYRLNTTTPQFNGRADDTAGASLTEPDLHIDSSGINQLLVHGVNTVMVPAKFMPK